MAAFLEVSLLFRTCLMVYLATTSIAYANGGRVAIGANLRQPAAPPSPLTKTVSVPPTSQLVKEFDVAGVRLGMSPSEAIGALGKRHYFIPDSVGYQKFDYDYASKFSGAVAFRRGTFSKVKSKDTVLFSANGPLRQQVSVRFAPAPVGMVAIEITYSIPASQIAWSDFSAKAIAKYGKNASYGNTLRFCYMSSNCATGFNDDILMPYISNSKSRVDSTPSYMHQFTLFEGSVITARRNTDFAKAVQKAAPMGKEADF